MNNLINVLQLIKALKQAGWDDEMLIAFAKTFYRIVQSNVEDPDYITESETESD